MVEHVMWDKWEKLQVKSTKTLIMTLFIFLLYFCNTYNLAIVYSLYDMFNIAVEQTLLL